MRDDIVPDVSLGTHFFNDLVETNMLYVAVFPNREGSSLSRAFFEEDTPNRLTDYLSGEPSPAARAVRVIRCADLPAGTGVRLHANTLKQRVVLYRHHTGNSQP